MWADFYRHYLKVVEILKDFHLGFIMEIIVNIAILYGICKALDIFVGIVVYVSKTGYRFPNVLLPCKKGIPWPSEL